jgi:hypothetical protein
MQLGNIWKLLQHCYGLQAKSGPGSAFRFSLISGPRQSRLFANYADSVNTTGNEMAEQRRKKKGKQREVPLQGLL